MKKEVLDFMRRLVKKGELVTVAITKDNRRKVSEFISIDCVIHNAVDKNVNEVYVKDINSNAIYRLSHEFAVFSTPERIRVQFDSAITSYYKDYMASLQAEKQSLSAEQQAILFQVKAEYDKVIRDFKNTANNMISWASDEAMDELYLETDEAVEELQEKLKKAGLTEETIKDAGII